jgi:hypothetical protein
MPLGLVLPDSYAPTLAIEQHRYRHELARDFCGYNDAPPGGQVSNTIAHFALDFERGATKFESRRILEERQRNFARSGYRKDM